MSYQYRPRLERHTIHKMAEIGESPRPTKRRKISNVEPSSQSSHPISRLSRVTKTRKTPQAEKGTLKQTLQDEEHVSDPGISSRNLRKRGSASQKKVSSPLAGSRLSFLSERVDDGNVGVPTKSVEPQNRTLTLDSGDQADVELLSYGDELLQSTPTKSRNSKDQAKYSSPGKDTLRLSRSTKAKNAIRISENGSPKAVGTGKHMKAVIEELDVREGNSKTPTGSKGTVGKSRNGSKQIPRTNDVAEVEYDAKELEKSPRSGQRARRKPPGDSSSGKQTYKPILPSSPASGKKRGRPRKVISDTTVKPQQNIDPPVIGAASDQLDSPSQEADGKGRSSPQRSLSATLNDSTQEHPQSPNQAKVSTSDKYLKPSTRQSWDLSIQESLKVAGSSLQALMLEDTSSCLSEIKTQILEGLTAKRRLPLVNLEQEYRKVHQLLEQTILAGEGNSMLVIGSRGTGKTTLVETAITELAVSHQEKFHVVRLNGFVQTDDKLALREIWRQLGRDMEVEDETTGRSNYADTLTSLLALLSHSAEAIDPDLQGHVAKSVIFILDEFDLFASHPRQTLLYNLFDVAQSRNAPIAVLGLTTKINVVESLEKRVKSRFGQRYVYLSSPRTFSSFQTICKSALMPPTTFGATFASRLAHSNTNFKTLLSAWSTYINALFEEDPIFQTFLLRTYTLTKSVPAFLAAALLPISLLSPTALPTGLSFASHPLTAPDSKLQLLQGLSNLELSLLIAAARLDIVLDSDLCTFGMAYDEYVALASKARISSSAAGQLAMGAGARIWSIEIARAAWERLVALEVIVPAIGGSAGVGGAKGEGSRMWRVDVSLEEIAPSVDGMGTVMVKWCKEI